MQKLVQNKGAKNEFFYKLKKATRYFLVHPDLRHFYLEIQILNDE